MIYDTGRIMLTKLIQQKKKIQLIHQERPPIVLVSDSVSYTLPGWVGDCSIHITHVVEIQRSDFPGHELRDVF